MDENRKDAPKVNPGRRIRSCVLLVVAFVAGAIVASGLVAWRYLEMFKHECYSGILHNANTVHLVRAGHQQELIKTVEAHLRQCVLSADALYGDDERRLKAFWHLQWYYEKFELPVPHDIKPILDRLPPRPPKVCRLRGVEDPNQYQQAEETTPAQP
ncbi:MAG: hypothetical protein ACYS8I_07175 [Planctomycetota bacterium]|jgi:hypothetical protein